MVLEKLYTPEFLKKNKYVIFLLSLTCTILGLAWSLIYFSNNHSFIALAFISLLLLFTLKDVIDIHLPTRAKDENKVAKQEYKDLLMIFFYIFIGIFLPFLFYSAMLPDNATRLFFTGQYELLATTSAQDIYSGLSIQGVFINNVYVFIGCLVSAFLFGLGAIFLFIIVWNASVLGVVLGVVARHTATETGIQLPLVILTLILAAFPHVILEVFAYFFAGTTGERVSDWLFFKGLNRKIFTAVVLLALKVVILSVFILFVAAAVESFFPSFMINLLL